MAMGRKARRNHRNGLVWWRRRCVCARRVPRTRGSFRPSLHYVDLRSTVQRNQSRWNG